MMRHSHLLIACVLVLGVFTAVWSYGQTRLPQTVTPMVLSGPDIGFRVEATKGALPVGRLVVRVNGQWVEPAWSPGVRQLTAR